MRSKVLKPDIVGLKLNWLKGTKFNLKITSSGSVINQHTLILIKLKEVLVGVDC